MSRPKILATPALDAYSFPLLIRHLLAGVAEQSGNQIVSGDVRLTYRQFVDRVARLAAALDAKGVRAGDTVAVMDWDSHRYLECYFAVPMMGAILQTVNVRLSPAQIAFTLNQSGASLILHHADFQPLCAAIGPSLARVREMVSITSTSSPDPYEQMLASAGTPHDFQDFDENAIATTFHTTGTTGDPKQVFFSHRQLVLHTLALTAALGNQPNAQGMRRSDVYMPITPMFHVHAWGVPFAATMLGMKQVYPGRYDAATLLRLKRDEGVTISHCVPTLLRMILDAGEGNPLGPWTIVMGGSALPPALAEEAARAGITALTGFGMSETGPVVSLARDPEGDVDKLCRAGFPLPLVSAQIDKGRGGELILRAPWLTQGYGIQDASDELWKGGWLHTGDVAAVDPDGALRIVDRLKDVVKTGGEWVSSIDLEARLMEHPQVAEAAVIGVPDARWGERPLAFITCRVDDPTSLPEELRARLHAAVDAGALSKFAVPAQILVVTDLPRTTVGKIDKKALRATTNGCPDTPAAAS